MRVKVRVRVRVGVIVRERARARFCHFQVFLHICDVYKNDKDDLGVSREGLVLTLLLIKTERFKLIKNTMRACLF